MRRKIHKIVEKQIKQNKKILTEHFMLILRKRWYRKIPNSSQTLDDNTSRIVRAKKMVRVHHITDIYFLLGNRVLN